VLDLQQPGQPQAVPLAQRAVRGGLWVAAASYWSIGFGFAANIVLTRLLTPEVYGEYALATFFALLFQLRSKVGLAYAYAQERTVTGPAVGTVFTLDLLLGLGGVLVGLIAAPILLALNYSAAVVAMMLTILLLILGESLFAVFVTTLEKELYFKPGSIISSVILPLSYLPAFWLAATGRGSLALIGQYVVFSLLSFGVFGVFIWRRMRWLTSLPWRFDRLLARRYLSYGLETGVATFFSSLATQVDNFVVGTRSGVTTLGFYDRGYRTAQWPNLLLNTLLSRSALFTYAQIKDDPARLRKSVSMVIWLIVTMGAPIALALAIAAPDLILLLYGERWLPAVGILRLLVIAAMLRPLWDNAFALFIGTGRPRHAIWIGALQVTIILSLGWLLSSIFSGPTGAPNGELNSAFTGFAGPINGWLTSLLGGSSGSVGGGIGVGIAVIVAYIVALIAAQRTTAGLLDLDLVGLIAKPLLAAVLVVGGYLVLTRLLPLNDWPLLIRVLAKSAYAVGGYYLFSFLLQPRATLDRLHYIRRLLR
jgi:PST family polysaccharide transporter